MAGQGTVAEVRVWRMTNGRLVGEHDPRGAFLAYNVGDEVPAERVEEYHKVRDGHLAEADEADLREQQVDHVPAGPAGERVFIHEDLATQLADTAQLLANLPDDVRVAVRQEVAGEGVIVADRRLLRTEDGDLVEEGNPDGLFLAYIPGDTVKLQDADSYEALSKKDGDEDTSAEDVDTKARTTAPANKARTTASTKAAAEK